MLENWVNVQITPKGIGIDCVCISQMKALDERLKGAFSTGTFTSAELAQARESADYWCFLAGRFAVKEAVFKALSCAAPNPFDFRQVETLRREDGCPMVNLRSIPESVMKQAGAKGILVSITGEADYAIALAQVV